MMPGGILESPQRGEGERLAVGRERSKARCDSERGSGLYAGVAVFLTPFLAMWSFQTSTGSVADVLSDRGSREKYACGQVGVSICAFRKRYPLGKKP